MRQERTCLECGSTWYEDPNSKFAGVCFGCTNTTPMPAYSGKEKR